MVEVFSLGYGEMVTLLIETVEVGVGIIDYDVEDVWRLGGAGGIGLEGIKRRSL